jgi:hypothetical protein
MFSPLKRFLDIDIPIDIPLKGENYTHGHDNGTVNTVNINTVKNVSVLLDDNKLLECFLNLPDENDLPFTLDLQRIATGQQNNQALWQRCLTNPLRYPEQYFGNTQVLTYLPTPNSEWKICIPTQQLQDLVNWYHKALSHCGLHRLLKTITMHIHHPNLRTTAENIPRNCDACQRQKLPGPQYAHLPPREAALVPWVEVALNLIGP